VQSATLDGRRSDVLFREVPRRQLRDDWWLRRTRWPVRQEFPGEKRTARVVLGAQILLELRWPEREQGRHSEHLVLHGGARLGGRWPFEGERPHLHVHSASFEWIVAI